MLVEPFDDPLVAAGQGTAALELLEDAPEPLERFYAPVSGGGLMAGCATIVADRSPATEIVGVEPVAGRRHPSVPGRGRAPVGPAARHHRRRSAGPHPGCGHVPGAAADRGPDRDRDRRRARARPCGGPPPTSAWSSNRRERRRWRWPAARAVPPAGVILSGGNVDPAMYAADPAPAPNPAPNSRPQNPVPNLTAASSPSGVRRARRRRPPAGPTTRRRGRPRR